MRVKQRVGAATLLYSWCSNEKQRQSRYNTDLIHMLAKQDTPINAKRTVFGSEPARLKTLVIIIRSIFALLKADDMVNPPIRSMIVGENITEKIHLDRGLLVHQEERKERRTLWHHSPT